MNRHTLFAPLIIGILAILLTLAVTVGWNVIFTSYYSLATEARMMSDLGVGYWLVLSIGDVFLALILTALVLFLVSSVRQTLYVRRQKTFIDSVTHELKSPLASLRLCLDTMEVRELTPPMRARFIQMMKDDVSRLQAFIEHVLEAGRIEHNERDLEFEPTLVPELVNRCIKQVVQRHHVSADRIAVEMTLTNAETPIISDPIALDIIVTNLLDNAIKYSPPNSPIRLRICDTAGRLQIEVKDQGIGIPRPKLKSIFRRFYRIRRKEVADVRGTGLGLYVVHSLVRRLSGRIVAESEGDQRGSTFRVDLPFQHPDAGLAGIRSKKSHDAPHSARRG